MRSEILEILNSFKVEMEGYSYYGSNPGIPEDDFEDVVNKILILFELQKQEDSL